MKFDGHTRGHHAYKEIWTSQKVDILYCKKDYRSEVLDIEKHVMGIYKEDRLVGAFTIIPYSLQESETNKMKVAMNGKNIWRSTQDIQRKVYSFLLAIRRAGNVLKKYSLKNKTS